LAFALIGLPGRSAAARAGPVLGRVAFLGAAHLAVTANKAGFGRIGKHEIHETADGRLGDTHHAVGERAGIRDGCRARCGALAGQLNRNGVGAVAGDCRTGALAGTVQTGLVTCLRTDHLRYPETPLLALPTDRSYLPHETGPLAADSPSAHEPFISRVRGPRRLYGG
jgi:hypothetical protein